MTTSTAQSRPQETAYPYYDPDEALNGCNSPPMQSFQPKLLPSPSPPPHHRCAQVEPHRSDAVLITYLSNDTRPDLLTRELATPVDHSHSDSGSAGESRSPTSFSLSSSVGRFRRVAMSDAITKRAEAASGPSDLKFLAAGALAFTSEQPANLGLPEKDRGKNPDGAYSEHVEFRDEKRPSVAETTPSKDSARRESVSDTAPLPIRKLSLASAAPVYPRRGYYSSSAPLTSASRQPDVLSPSSPLPSETGGLPPLQIDSSTSDSGSHTQALPSIRQHFSDLALSPDRDLDPAKQTATYSRSPPGALPGISSMTSSLPVAAGHISPPISPHDGVRRDLPSPQALNSSGFYFPSVGRPQRTIADQAGIGLDMGGGDHSSPLGLSTSSSDRANGDATGPAQHGTYTCNVPGCTAAPFSTQYLLNSHANVHSSARPHYCPVEGCPRGEGGKGFKRKNEMIRHGLVHESPGYVCPYCPDREHRYPRPDNLQRHVRVHHVDKDKDDPLLRDVLALRPDGPNRGRRRRGGQ